METTLMSMPIIQPMQSTDYQQQFCNIDGQQTSFDQECLNGNLELAKQLYEQLCISRDYITNCMVLPFTVCERQQLEVMKWLHSVCNFTRDELENLFSMLCRSKTLNVEISQWLHQQCNFTRNEIRYYLKYFDNVDDMIKAKEWIENIYA